MKIAVADTVRIGIMLPLLFVLSVCIQRGSEPTKSIKTSVDTVCTEPRPQMCTKEYKPVCAMLKDGAEKTYSTGCTACVDTKVLSYTQGACRALAH